MFTPSAASNREVTVSREQKDQEVSNSEKISLRKASKGLQKEWKISLCLFVCFFFLFFLFWEVGCDCDVGCCGRCWSILMGFAVGC